LDCLPQETRKLDRIDRRLLAILVDEGRISWRELAERVGLSLTPTLRRVERLQESGFIVGFGAKLDEARLGGGVSVFVSITLQAQTEAALARFEKAMSAAPEVMSCFLMTGDADYLLRVVVPDLESFQDFMMNRLTRIAGVAHIKSSFALRPVIQRSAPAL
jgi:Lrp/AsnC family transcriptional regulator, leucine-responsive regulatory protein